MKSLDYLKQQTAKSELVKIEDVKAYLKGSFPDKYDQMIVLPEIKPNHFFIVDYSGVIINRKISYAQTPMFTELKRIFNLKLEGGEASYGKNKIVEDSDLNQILSKSIIIKETFNTSNSKIDANSLKSFVLINEDNKESYGSIKILSSPASSILNDIKSTFKSNKSIDLNGVEDFLDVELIVDNKNINQIQPIYFIPSLTYTETCYNCDGEKYVICDSCGGKHEYNCPDCGGKGEVSCWKCKGTGKEEYQEDGRIKYRDCKECRGSKYQKCSKCNGKGLLTCKKCYGDRDRYGKVDCPVCKTTGELGSITYIQTEIIEKKLRLLYSETEIFKIIKKDKSILTTKIDENIIDEKLVYFNPNGEDNSDYEDDFSIRFSNLIENELGVNKENYPKVVKENIKYFTIPCVLISYNHILTGSLNNILIVNNGIEPEYFYLSDPFSVKFSFGSLFRQYRDLIGKAFQTKRSLNRLDKKNEIALLIRVAKSDGEIEEVEKEFLFKEIGGVKDFSNKDRRYFYSLMTSSQLPELEVNDIVLTTKEKADNLIDKLHALSALDKNIENEELIKINLLKDKIYSNIGKKENAFLCFLKTWQVSIPLIILFFFIIGVLIYMLLFTPKTISNSDFSKINSDSTIIISNVDKNNEASMQIEPKSQVQITDASLNDFIKQGSVAGIIIGGNISHLSSVFSIKRTIEYGEEMSENIVYEIIFNDILAFKVTPQLDDKYNETDYISEIMVFSPSFKTENGIGVNSTVQDFLIAYPDYSIWYTYISDMFVIETNDLKGVQFVIDGKAYVGSHDLTQSDMVTLSAIDFKSEAKINSVRILSI